MSKKLTKKQLEIFAKIHVSTFTSYIDASALDGYDMDEDEKDRCVKAIGEIGDKIGKNLPRIANNKDILDYVRLHY